MLGREVHTNFCAVLVWEMQEPQKKTASVKKCSDYYPFGLTMPGCSANTANPNDNYQFTGHELDDEAGLNLIHMGARGTILYWGVPYRLILTTLTTQDYLYIVMLQIIL